ncbi:MAG: phosphonate C-P lyase system protein PhnG [Rhizobiaceae bacterium]|nr:phosphonate C-P lyase system protein PhnG [Rhizobiaceae bacterium]MCV0405977.1 phosphonate C-P lyase system protein PhnG [Rhizobiaceae bacterium]
MPREREAEINAARHRRMAALAHADGARIAELWTGAGLPVDCEVLRGPETGLVMLRGRIGGGGGRFNLGDATVTRMTVRIPSGEIGHAYALGRDGDKARLSALADALGQSPAYRETVEARIVAPLLAEAEKADRRRRGETAATKVDFFTMVRGED